MNQKCTPLCMLMNINSRRVYAVFSKCFLLRFFYKETFQSKYVSTFDTFVKIVPTTFKKLLSLFFEIRKKRSAQVFSSFLLSLRLQQRVWAFSTLANFKMQKEKAYF